MFCTPATAQELIEAAVGKISALPGGSKLNAGKKYNNYPG